MKLIPRIRDLVLKMVGVKGLFATASFIVFAINPSEYSFYAFIIFGSLLVVGREYGKLLEVLKVIKGK